MILTGTLAPVDKGDFKKVWLFRREHGNAIVDADLFRKLCKPETDFLAAAHRAGLLFVIVENYPTLMAPFMIEGNVSDAFLKAFACFPMEAGGSIDLAALTHTISDGA